MLIYCSIVKYSKTVGNARKTQMYFTLKLEMGISILIITNTSLKM